MALFASNSSLESGLEGDLRGSDTRHAENIPVVQDTAESSVLGT